MTTYRFYSDPAHGWLRVPYADLVDLGIASKITQFSYRKGRWAYLEEDVDAPLFMREHARKYGAKPRLTESTCNNRSAIRSYAPYQADPPIKVADPVLDPMRVQVQRGLLQYAAGRKIFCDCGKVLDWQDVVVLTIKGKGTTTCCSQCWIDGSNQAYAKYGQAALDMFNRWAETDCIDSAHNWHWQDGKMRRGAQLVTE